MNQFKFFTAYLHVIFFGLLRRPCINTVALMNSVKATVFGIVLSTQTDCIYCIYKYHIPDCSLIMYRFISINDRGFIL